MRVYISNRCRVNVADQIEIDLFLDLVGGYLEPPQISSLTLEESR
jgi:hypothetical protein